MKKHLCALLLAFACPALAAPKWLRLESGRWELYTDAGEKPGSALLRQLIEIENVFGALATPLPESTPPVRVVLLKDAADFAPFRHVASNRGIYQPAPDREYIVLVDGQADTLARAARHEFVHLSLNHTILPLPVWLGEGLAEYFSTLQRKGDKVIVGRAIPAHLQLLNSTQWLEPQQLFAVREESPLYNDSRLSAVFYAQSWALTHVLMRAPQAQLRLRRFGELLQSGVDQSSAFEQAFERSIGKATEEARSIVSSGHFAIIETPLGAIPQPSSLQVDNLEEPEFLAIRAELLLAGNHAAEAEKLILETSGRWPDRPASVASLGALALRKSDYAAARGYLERAVALDDSRAATHFEYAMLLHDTGGAESKVIASLTRTVQLSPSHADAWYLLGSAYLRQNRPADAIPPFQRATEIQPRRSIFWEALGRAYLEHLDREPAREAALRATLTAATPEQSALALGLTREIEAADFKRPAAKPAVLTTAAWEPPKGDASVTGRLVLVDCSKPVTRFTIETKPPAGKTPPERTILAAEKLNQVILRGSSAQKREFVCGPQQPAPEVNAGYFVRAAPPPPPEPPKPEPPKAAPPKPGAKAPVRRPAAPAKPKQQEVPPAGDLIWLEFK